MSEGVFRIQLVIGALITIDEETLEELDQDPVSAAWDGFLANHEYGTVSDLWLHDYEEDK